MYFILFFVKIQDLLKNIFVIVVVMETFIPEIPYNIFFFKCIINELIAFFFFIRENEICLIFVHIPRKF